MRQFEDALRLGLMDANLAQYQLVLQDADEKEVNFSPGYLRERMRLLADPWGWMRRREALRPRRRGRLNWKVVALIAAMLLLSACAYVLVTGQFTQWFPSRGVDPQSPETSEEVLGRTGTLIEETRTEGDAAITLNAAVWDGESLLLSIVMKCPDIPEEFTPGPSGPYGKGLHTAECYLSMREDQWFEYERERLSSMNWFAREAEIRKRAEEGYKRNYGLDFQLIEREGDILTFEVHTFLLPYVERPEMTLHMEKLSFFGDDKFHIDGPFDFTFTLEKVFPDIRYQGGVVETTLGKPPLREVPLRFTEFQVSTSELLATGKVPAPMTLHGEFPSWAGIDIDEVEDPLDIVDLNYALWEGPLGVWTEDGGYIDLTNAGPGISGGYSGNTLDITLSFYFPYPVDPATVTALEVGDVRVEFSEWERLDE